MSNNATVNFSFSATIGTTYLSTIWPTIAHSQWSPYTAAYLYLTYEPTIATTIFFFSDIATSEDPISSADSATAKDSI